MRKENNILEILPSIRVEKNLRNGPVQCFIKDELVAPKKQSDFSVKQLVDDEGQESALLPF